MSKHFGIQGGGASLHKFKENFPKHGKFLKGRTRRGATGQLMYFATRGKNCHAKIFREDLCARGVAADENGTKSGHFGKQREEERGAQIQVKSSQTW